MKLNLTLIKSFRNSQARVRLLSSTASHVGKLAACLALVASSAQAQFTYTGGDINANQTYDGLGVDSAMNPKSIGTTGDNDYVGHNVGNSGSLTVLSGSLTITNSDFKVGASSGTGAVYMGQNATLNLECVGQWAPGVGQNGGAAGTLVVSNNATININIGGSQEQRMTWGVNSGTMVATILGGTINVNNGTGTSDNQRSFNVGAQNGTGTVNLFAGTITDNMPLPFSVGGQYDAMNTSPVFNDSSTSSSLIISNGSFVMTNICPTTDAGKSTFNVGSNSYVVFYNGTGSLSLANWTSGDYQTLVDAGRIRIGLPGQTPIVTTMSSFTYNSVGGQGILTVVPFVLPPSIAGQPQSQIVVTGTTLQMKATGISGNTPFAYQWQLSGTNLADNITFSGVNSNILTIANVSMGAAGSYQLVVTNLYGSTTSSVAILTVSSPTLVGRWVNGPASLSDASGYSLATAHEAIVVGVGSYMFTNDVPTGKSGQSLYLFNGDTALSISNSATGDATYDNTFDDVINNQFSVMFWAKGMPPAWSPWVSKGGDGGSGWQVRAVGDTNYSAFTIRGTGGTNTMGSGVEDLTATGSPTGDGNWHLYAGTYDALTGERNFYVDGVLAGSEIGNVKYPLAADRHLCIGAREDTANTPASFATTEIFNVNIYNYAISLGQIQTELGVLPPAISGQPQSIYALVGRPAQVKATGVSGTAPLTYQWTLNGTNIQLLADSANFTGATSNTLTILSVAAIDAGSYQLTVTSIYGTAVSSNAVLSVKYPSVVGRWFVGSTNLNDTSGYTSTNTHDGVAVGGSSYQFAADVPPGRHGMSLDLPSGNTGIAINNSSTADGSYTNTFDAPIRGSMSFSFWSKGYPNGNWSPWVAKGGDNNNQGWSMRTIGWSAGWGNWNIFTMRGGGGSGGDDLGNNSGTTDGNWHLYTGTFDAGTGLRTLYRDGVQRAQSTGCGLYNLAPTSHLTVGVKDAGNANYDAGTYFTGKFYDVRVYNYDLSAAEVGALTNLPNPSVANPQSITTYIGGVARMSSTVSGTGTLTNRWQFNGTDVVDGTYGSVVISGATTTTLTISNVTAGYAGSYRVIVSNTNGMDISDAATLTLNAPALIGQWFTGADSYADVSGYTPPGTHDASSIGGDSFLNDVPPGKTGDSLSLSSGGVIINNSAVVDGAGYTNTFDDKISGAFTLMFWAKGYPQNWNPWVSKNGDGGVGWQARTPSWGTNFAMFTMRGTGANDDQNAWTNPDANWHNYACTYDAGTGLRTMYRDGFQLFQLAGNGPYTLAPNSHLVIGARDAGNFSYGSTFFTGGFYDVRVYNYPLTIGDVNAYLGTTPSFSGSPVINGNNLTLQWSFGTLLGSTNVAGPYLAVPGATSPYTIGVSTAPQMFYKLSNP